MLGELLYDRPQNLLTLYNEQEVTFLRWYLRSASQLMDACTAPILTYLLSSDILANKSTWYRRRDAIPIIYKLETYS
jgi:hypothetical protein